MLRIFDRFGQAVREYNSQISLPKAVNRSRRLSMPTAALPLRSMWKQRTSVSA